ncbi:MAG TPA: hypothetical protein ENI19_02190 [Candidatus Nealsonbacteria bacterium]|uniref:Uncharacterized protein n=1 Tax=marine sediment metagenome TaxID=412755 RepID=A0A0F9VFI6_9ZZZZ|nr:hypothetical protein [Candidatus Nealsonbacteria bacterium]HEB46497.1 hypothetical protein [Candidatus Nealsonbacteria bacterium]
MRLQDAVLFPKDPVIWPDGFLPIQGWDQRIQIRLPVAIGSFDEIRVAQAMSQKTIEMMTNSGSQLLFKKIKIEIRERTYWLALQIEPQGFIIFDPPLESRSKKQKSNAVYYAASEKWGLLVQYIPPDSRTSSHDHSKSRWIETNHPLIGGAKLCTSENRQQQLTYHLTMANPISPVITPRVIHQISTDDQPLLNIIEITGDPDWFKKWKNGGGHTFETFPQQP